MYKKAILALYNKSFDIPDSADSILWIITVTRKTRLGTSISALLSLIPRAGLTLTGVVLWIAAMILSGGQAPQWDRKETNSEISSLVGTVDKLYPNTPIYTGLNRHS